ncbi:serine hydrolase domain-containing protein [Paenibacillus macerans]|uniref:serine hydrolase domain-containing protein n=1 Tax=Paenibacillus macerans TaxID=44252 RepID=UPI002E1F63AE|nr:serine hydrolase [Paenibacillus macerans]
MKVEIVMPESVGMNSIGLENVTKNIQKDIDRGVTNGAVVLAARKGQVCYCEAIGSSDIEEQRPAKIDDVFLLMSLTKSITAVAVLKAVEQGKFRLDTRVAEIFPEFAANGKANLTILQLLTHQVNLWNTPSPLPGLKMSDMTNIETIAITAALLTPTSKIGEVAYQPYVTFTVLAHLLVLTDEKKRSYTQIIQDEIFTPLGMNDSSIGRDIADTRRVPAVFSWSFRIPDEEAER